MGRKRWDVQAINYTHLMPTRYALELEGLKGAVSESTLKEPSQRVEAKKTVKKIFEERYTGGKNRWFFTPLRVRPFPRSCLACRRLTCVDAVLSYGRLVFVVGTGRAALLSVSAPDLGVDRRCLCLALQHCIPALISCWHLSPLAAVFEPSPSP